MQRASRQYGDRELRLRACAVVPAAGTRAFLGSAGLALLGVVFASLAFAQSTVPTEAFESSEFHYGVTLPAGCRHDEGPGTLDVVCSAELDAEKSAKTSATSALVLEVGGEPVWIEERHRGLYHAALAHGANHLVTLIAQAMEALGAAGVADPHRMLEPLVSAALDNSLRAGDAALTGPVARGDVGTVAEHLRQLEPLSPDIRATYVALARATAERALARGRLKPMAAEPLLDILASDQER